MPTPWERRQQAAMRGIPIGMQDPAMDYRGPQAAVDVQGKQAQIQKTRQDMALDPQRLDLQRRQQATAEQNAGLARQQQEAQLRAAQTEQARNRAQWDEFGGIINSLTDQYYKNFKGRGGSSQRGVLAELMPGNLFGRTINSENDKFNSTAMRAGPFLMSIMFPNAKATDAAAEYQQKVMPFIPKAGDSDAVIADKIKQLRRIYEGQMKAIGGSPARTTANAPRKQPKVIDFNQWGK